MTLIITCLADDAVVQVADRRLTLPDGTIFSEHANKTICVTCSDALIAISYTGLARLDGYDLPTDHWIVDTLAESHAATRRFPELMDILQERLNANFHGLKHLGNQRGLTVAIGGVGPPGVFSASLSNQEDSAGNWLPQVADTFRADYWFRNDKPMHKLDCMVHGADSTVGDALRDVIERIRVRFLHRSPKERIRVFVQVIRLAANDAKFGWRVGKDCLGVSVSPVDGFETTYHDLGAGPVQYLPHYVAPHAAFKDAWISTDPTQRPPWWPPRTP